MTPMTFDAQMNRLQVRFGNRAIDEEFSRLVWRECASMLDEAFIRFVDVMIGSRTHTKAPLLAEFREARLAEEKHRFNRDVQGAAQAFEHGWSDKPTSQILHELGYTGCKTLVEAMELEIHRRQILRADGINPDTGETI